MTAPVYCPFCSSAAAPGDALCRVCGAALGQGGATALLTLPPGTTLQGGQYVLDRVLGQGGFGITYDARAQRLGLRVAIKELFVSGSSRRGQSVVPPLTGAFEQTKKDFLAEARILARFNHPGIVRVFNYFEENGTAYLVMEFLEGETLGEAITGRGPLPPLVAAEVADTIAGTLEVVHIAGLLHRDIKPDNIFLEHTGRIVLIDFGSVREFEVGKTVSHTRLVTPGYAPLEQYSSAARFGPYTDIYALGATLFHALTGQMPPPATDLSLGTPLPPLPPGTPPNLRQAVRRAMAPRIDQRPQSATLLRQILRGQESQPLRIPALPRKPAPPPPPAPAPVPAPPPPQPAPVPVPPPAPIPVPSPSPSPSPSRREVKQQRAEQRAAQKRAERAARQQSRARAREAARRRRAAGRGLGRALLVVLGMGAGAVLGPELLASLPEPLSLPREACMAVGAVLGGVAGALLWWALPVVLPLVMALTAYTLTQNLGYGFPTVFAATLAAIVLSALLMRLLRRI